MPNLLAIGLPGGGEWILLAVLGLLLFGKRLPEVGRSIAQGIVEFKKGLKGIEQEVDEAVDSPAAKPREALPEHRFDPMTGKPLAEPQYKFDPITGKPLMEAGSESSTSAAAPPASH